MLLASLAMTAKAVRSAAAVALAEQSVVLKAASSVQEDGVPLTTCYWPRMAFELAGSFAAAPDVC